MGNSHHGGVQTLETGPAYIGILLAICAMKYKEHKPAHCIFAR